MRVMRGSNPRLSVYMMRSKMKVIIYFGRSVSEFQDFAHHIADKLWHEDIRLDFHRMPAMFCVGKCRIEYMNYREWEKKIRGRKRVNFIIGLINKEIEDYAEFKNIEILREFDKLIAVFGEEE